MRNHQVSAKFTLKYVTFIHGISSYEKYNHHKTINQMKKIIASLIFLSLIISIQSAKSQTDEVYIYGTITTIDDDIYTGPIRWGDEEVYWTDMFNSEKRTNDNLKYLTNADREEMEERGDEWYERLIRKYVNEYDSHNHTFVCQFGDIKSLRMTGRDKVELRLKNDFKFHLRGGSNDIGATVRVIDEDLGLIKLNWERIEKVEFKNTPKNLSEKFGEALYGTVETKAGSFTGQVQWDHDERLSEDVLDGDAKDGEVSIKFGKINTIAKEGRGSLIVLNSGKELHLTGTNDVNESNKGIIVTVEDIGRVDISWESVRKVTFHNNNEFDGLSYSDFPEPGKLAGTVIPVDENTVSGLIIYDLDEMWDIEILQGEEEDIDFLIPFRNIKRIAPKNYHYTRIELRNGEAYTLSGSQDVNDSNDGILVFENEEEPAYIPWDEVDEVVFK